MRVNAHTRRTGPEVAKNVTRQSPLHKDIAGHPELKIYSCPL